MKNFKKFIKVLEKKNYRFLDISNTNKIDFKKIEKNESGYYKVRYSTEAPTLRYDDNDEPYYEILSNEDVDLSRLKNNAPLLYNHDDKQILGSVKDAWIENKEGFALFELSSTAQKEEILLMEGHLVKISHGYEFGEKTEIIDIGYIDDIPAYIFKGYTTFEISLCPIAQDDRCHLVKSLKIKDFKLKSLTTKKGSEIMELEELKKKLKLLEKELEEKEEEIKTKNKVEKSDDETSDETNDENDDVTSQDETLETDEEKELKEQIKEKEKKLASISQKNLTTKKGSKNMDKEILELGKSYGELELATDFALKGKTVEDFKNALLEKRHSTVSTLYKNKADNNDFNLAGYVYEKFQNVEGENTKKYRNLKNGVKGLRISRLGNVKAKQDMSSTSNMSHIDQRSDLLVSPLYSNPVYQQISTVYPSGTGFGSVTYPIMGASSIVEVGADGVPATEKNIPLQDSVTFSPRFFKGKIVLTREMLLTNTVASMQQYLQVEAEKQFIDNRNNVILKLLASNTEVVANAVDFDSVTNEELYEKVVELSANMSTANIDESNAKYVFNSRVASKLKTTQEFESTGMKIFNNGVVDGKQALVTNSSEVANKLLLVAPEQVGVIDWEYVEVSVKVDENDNIIINLYDTFDVQILRTAGVQIAKNVSFG